MKRFIKKALSVIMVCCCFFSIAACNKQENGGTSSSSDTQICTHSYTSKVTKKSTCIEAGVKTYTCNKCGDSYTENIAVNPYAHTGKYECSICYKNYGDCIQSYLFEHGIEGGTAYLKRYTLRYNYYDESEHHYELYIEVTTSTTYFLLTDKENNNNYIGIYLNLGARHKLKIAGEDYDFPNPEIVTPTLNILFDSPEVAKNIKILLDAMNRFFVNKNLGIGTKNFGFTNYPSNGD